MHLAHAIAAGGLAARLADRRPTARHGEVREAEQRVFARRTAAAVVASGAAAVAASGARTYTERGRHAAPRARA